ncbi:hypothetical protein WJX73_004714 [Symbiochloris irregularis]|uniref:Hemimethylated DNA-binding domain-containing protein n=1 Tax=Symbiochloris irregularis TaxID=706552 RepID=A0AAW1NX19_9CHLO
MLASRIYPDCGCFQSRSLPSACGSGALSTSRRACRRANRRQRSAAITCASLEVETELEQVSDALSLKRAEMTDCVSREDYSRAADARDAAHLLELTVRKLQIQLDGEKRAAVRYKLGQCIVHRKYSYRGVIVGFHTECEAGEGWIQTMRVDTLPFGRKQPFYNVLVDGADRPGGHTTYVAQENIVLDKSGEPISHPLMEKLFSEFKDGAYVPRPGLLNQQQQDADR